MKWPAALINVNDQRNVKISGAGTIDGRGQKWWDKYWALRREYEPKGLRWASDYDAERVRLLVVWRSSDVTVENLSLERSGFWTVQVVYSDHVTVDGIKISDNGGPSTDGVDIDSSSHVLVQNCDIDNNDDDICLKAGRDSDGLRVARPTEYVLIRDNITRRGGGHHLLRQRNLRRHPPRRRPATTAASAPRRASASSPRRRAAATSRTF